MTLDNTACTTLQAATDIRAMVTVDSVSAELVKVGYISSRKDVMEDAVHFDLDCSPCKPTSILYNSIVFVFVRS